MVPSCSAGCSLQATLLDPWVSALAPVPPMATSSFCASPLTFVASLRTAANWSRAAQLLHSIQLLTLPTPRVSAQHFVSQLLGYNFLCPVDMEPKAGGWWR